ncbi:DUF6308 family protein [Pseudomonas lactucae]|uniref:DUF6308 family protein n=1 Tax=Pseudomonas lactucae TaxID=2813360 RepID=UPI002FCD0BC3
MKDIFDLETTLRIDPDNAYIRAYPHMLSSLAGQTSFTERDFICAAHMVYGWMPTILEIHATKMVSVAMGAQILTEAKQNGALSHAQLINLAQLVNHSVVGASKLLHFVNPDAFPIWDSRIYAFVHGVKAHQYRVNNAAAYEHYIALLRDLQKDKRLATLRASIDKKMGYPVSALRALEVVMFLS